MQNAGWSYLESKSEYNKNFKKIVENKKNEYMNLETCENCGSDLKMEYHHVVPLIFKGTNEITNIKRFCRDCHQKLHGILKVVPLKTEQNPFIGIQLAVLFPEFLKNNCDNCSSSKGLSMRIVVPFEVGGQHVKGNFSTLCKNCNHILDINVDENGILEHSHLIKLGQAQAILDGKILGRPKVNQNIIKHAVVDFYMLNLDTLQLSKKYRVSITSIYRYKRRFDNLYNFKKISQTAFILLDKKSNQEVFRFDSNQHAA